MANHFRDALDKLTSTELSVVVAPLLGLIKLSLDETLDPDAVRRFLERYDAAVQAHGHEIDWVIANGRRFDEELVVGSGEAARRYPDAPWRQLVFSVTGGEIGHPNQPFGTLVALEGGSTTTLADVALRDRPVLLWFWGVGSDSEDVGAVTLIERFARAHRHRVQLVGVGSGGDLGVAMETVRRWAIESSNMVWEAVPSLGPMLGVDGTSGLVVVSADLQHASEPIGRIDPETLGVALELAGAFAAAEQATGP